MDPSSGAELDAVLDLFRKVFPRALSREFYRWRFLENPFGPAFVTLLWDGDVLAGHYAASAMRSWVDGEIIPTAQSMTTMTHPDYRNRDVFTTLANHLYGQMSAAGRRLIWGFPNTKSHFGLVQRLGWSDVALVPTMTLELGDASSADDVVCGTPQLSTVDALFHKSPPSRRALSARDARYFQWRYLDNPENRYEFLALRETPHDAILVAKRYATGTHRSLEIVDYWYGDRPQAAAELLRAAAGWARRQGCDLIRTWSPLSDPLHPFLEKLRFAPREPLTYYCIRPLADAPPRLSDPTVWMLTMGDSDNY
jgi:GNAT superfamily N-acetyltransferase